MSRHDENDAAGACGGCSHDAGGTSRRDFLSAAIAALATLGLAGPAAAFPIRRARAGAGAGAMRSYAIPAADGAQIDRENEVIVVRSQNSVYAFALSCPHQNTALRWQPAEGQFQCPKHHSRYRPDGTFIRGRATRGMDRFAVHREGGAVLVDMERLIEQTEDPAAWNAAVVRL